MIGEGIKSTNQRKHSYVQDHVEVGFFTDPSVCIGCKACEVACKEWNQVPDDGFTWSGNSYDNTGHLGASTWRIEEITRDRVIVTPAPGVPGAVPFWKGDGIGRPAELGGAAHALVQRERVAGLEESALAKLGAAIHSVRAVDARNR